ncbi:MAG TPA: DUF3006 domain-containing protein [Longimicrobium sp.]|nr:DUF3006 domain-containing protein [Longimicrobium sp.]
MKLTWTIDSIEEDVAAASDEAGVMIHLPVSLLPDDTREGDVVTAERATDDDGTLTLRIRVDRAATEAALRRSREQLAELKRGDDPGGDIYL